MNKNKLAIAVTAAACTAVFVLCNLTVQLAAEKINLRFDCTENKIFQLSEQTKDFLKTVDEDVTFYYMTDSGEEYPYVTQTIDRYLKECKNIRLKKLDIVKNPAAVEKYKTAGSVDKGTIAVESSKRFKLVDPGAALMIMTGNENVSGNLGFALEEKLTNAIDFVIRDSNPTVKYAIGHNGVDFAIPAQKLSDENIAVERLDIENSSFSAEDTDLLVIFGFREDISKKEDEKIRAYLDEGGSLYIAFNPGIECGAVKQLAQDYGIKVNNDAVTEDSFSNVIKNNKLYLLVNPVSNVCENLGPKGSLLFPAASSITLGGGAYAAALTKDSAKTREIINGNLGRDTGGGKIALAAFSENAANGSKLFVTSTTQVFKPEDKAISGIMNSFDYINREYFVQCMKYLIDEDGMNISIAPKSIMSKSLHLGSMTKLVISGIFIIIPIAALVCGLYVGIRRRNR